MVTNQAGTLVEATSYDPWGEVKSGGTANKFMYTGQEKDSETGLLYYNARYYDPHIRRFIQPDDIIQNVYNPQDLNRYAYARNNPIKYTDPTGHVSILDYNKVLSNYTPAAYNKVLTQFANIPGNKALQNYATNKPSSGGGGGGNSNGGGNNSSGGGGGNTAAAPPPPPRPGHTKTSYGYASAIAKPVYNFWIGDDIATLQDPGSTLDEKGMAAFFLATNVVPIGKVAKAGKAAELIVDLSKTADAEKIGMRAGEFKFSINHPGRVDEHHGTSLDGTAEGIYKSGYPYSHTVWKNGEVVFQRNQSGKIDIQTWR